MSLAGLVIAFSDLCRFSIAAMSSREGLAHDFARSEHDLAVAMIDSTLDSGSG